MRIRRWPVTISLVFASAYAQPAELPAVDTANLPPAIGTQIREAENNARARPRDPAAAGTLAMTLHAYQKYDAAVRAYARASLLEPGNFDWLYLLGAAQMELGQFEAAAKSLQSALRVKPKDLAAELRLAQSLASIPRWNEAEPFYRRILEAHPECPQAWYGLARAQSAQADHAGAAQSYVKACALFPDYGAAHFALAAELRRLGNKAEAEKHLAIYSGNATTVPPLDDPLFARVHALNQGTQNHLQRGLELEKAGNIAEAIRENEAALSIDANNVQAHVNLVSLYGRAGDQAKARQHFQTVIGLRPGRSDAWYDYGVLLFGQHNFPEAEKAFRRALEINPNYAEAHNNLGTIYERRGRLAEAAQEFREAIAARPDYPLARFHLGRILVNQGEFGQAIAQFEKALEPESEQTPVYIYALAAACARAGDRQRALLYMQKAHDAAQSRGQSGLLASIDRDLKALTAGQ